MPSLHRRVRRVLEVPRARVAPPIPAEWGLVRFDKNRSLAPDLILVLLCLILWLVPAGLSELRNADEARYVLIAHEWLLSGKGVCMTFFGEPYDQKPPLPFFLLAAMLKVTGGEVLTFFVRIPSIALGTAAVLATWRIGRGHLGELAGFIAALVLMTSMRWMKDVPTTELNIMFSGWIALSLACWFLRPEGKLSPARTIAMWGFLAAAFFTKGPFALIIVASVLATEAAVTRSWRPYRESRCIVGMIGVVALIALWFLAERIQFGAEFVREQVEGESVDRFLQGKHRQPHGYYVLRVFHTIMFPWGLALIPMSIAVWKRARELPPILTTALVGWGLIPMIVLTLASGKREPYPLPLLPGLSLVVAYYVQQFIGSNRKMPRVADGLMWSYLGWCCALITGAALTLLKPNLCEARGAFFRPWQMIPLVALVAAFGIGATLIRRWRTNPTTPVLGLAGMLFLTGFFFTTIVKPSADPNKSSRGFSRALDGLLAARGFSGPIGLIDGAAKPEYHVYGQYSACRIEFERDVAGHGGRSLPAVLLIRGKDWEDPTAFDSALRERGYRRESTMIAARDELEVYVRDGAGNATLGGDPKIDSSQ